MRRPADRLDAVPMRYHGPGWSVEPTQRMELYLLWAPSDRRPEWKACWQSPDGLRGGFRTAGTAVDALGCFPRTGRPARAAEALRRAAETAAEPRS